MNRNQLKMNDAKTEFIVFGSKDQVQRNDLKSLNIDDTTIRAKFVIKFLGAYLDESAQHEDSYCQQNQKCTL